MCLGETAWSIQNLISTETRNGIKEVNLNRLIYLFINERTLDRPVETASTKEKPQYSHGLDIREEDMVNLEQEDGIDGKVIDIKCDEEKGEDDDIEILGASSRGPKRARLE